MSPRKSTKIEKRNGKFAAYDKNGKLLILSHSSKVVKGYVDGQGRKRSLGPQRKRGHRS